jgi:hypothetical protein
MQKAARAMLVAVGFWLVGGSGASATPSCKSVRGADAAGTDVLDTVCPDAAPVGSSPIPKHVVSPGDGMSDFARLSDD